MVLCKNSKLLCLTTLLLLGGKVFSQFKVYPLLGLSRDRSQIVSGKNDKIGPVKSFADFDFGLLFSFRLRENYFLSAGMLKNDIGIGYRFTQDTEEGKRIHSRYSAPDFWMFPVHLSKQTKLIQFWEKGSIYKSGFFKDPNPDRPKQKFYLFNFKLSPFVGASFNHVRPSFSNANEDGFLTSSSGDATIRLYNGINNESLVNKYGYSLQTGTRVQFMSYGRERLSIYFILNLGLTTHFKNHVLYKIGDEPEQRADFITRSNFWGLYVSYPITVVNKKGERRKDRN